MDTISLKHKKKLAIKCSIKNWGSKKTVTPVENRFEMAFGEDVDVESSEC